jgi:hypothetical protein
MLDQLKQLLQFLEVTINLQKQNEVFENHRRSLNWEPVEKLPVVVSFPYPKSQKTQPFPHSVVFDNPEKMLFNELVHAFDTSIILNSEVGDDLPFTIRANFGTVIIASLFGGKVEQRGENPPWVRHFETPEEFNSIFDRDPLDFSQGICPQVFARYKFYRDVLEDYPNLQKCIKVVLPDLQGPLDTLELLRGSSVYEDFIMDPELVEKGLHLMARAQVGFAKHLQQYLTEDIEGYSHQHTIPIKGNILIRNDSAIMISPEMYASQVAHHDEYVLIEMGGGGIHSCGKIDFNIPEILKLPSIQCFDFGQSQLNDLDLVYPLAKEKKIPLVRIRVKKDELLSGKINERFPTGVSLVYDANSFEEARAVVKNYKNGT